MGLGITLSEACPRSADATIDFDGNIHIRADSTNEVYKLGRLLSHRWRAALMFNAFSAERGLNHRDMDSFLLSDTADPNS